MIAEVYNDEVKLDPCHELTHVIMGTISNPPALFNEGLAIYMQVGHIWKEQHVDKIAADLFKSNRLIPLTQLITREEIGSKPDDGQVAYPESASFVKFLIDNYGKERFLKVYMNLKNGGKDTNVKKNISYIKEFFGYSLDDLEREWCNFLMQLP